MKLVCSKSCVTQSSEWRSPGHGQRARLEKFNTGRERPLDSTMCREVIADPAVLAQVHCLQLETDLYTPGMASFDGIIVRSHTS